MQIWIALLFLWQGAGTRGELATRFGAPHAEVFLLDRNLKLTATYGGGGVVCSMRLETRAHGDRATAALTDERFWTDAAYVDRLLEELIAVAGSWKESVTELRAGEQMTVRSNAAVQITRIQRTRRPLGSEEPALADRLVRIEFLQRTECAPTAGSGNPD